jgi:hypothetical protein
MIFRKKVIELKMCVFIFCTTFLKEFSEIKIDIKGKLSLYRPGEALQAAGG